MKTERPWTVDELHALQGVKKRVKLPKQPSPLEEEFQRQITFAKLPQPEREYKFLTDRRFKLDYAWPAQKLAVELEGAVWTQGRHTRGAGYISDCKKYNLLTMHGWRLLRYTRDEVFDGSALQQVEEALRPNTQPDTPKCNLGEAETTHLSNLTGWPRVTCFTHKERSKENEH